MEDIIESSRKNKKVKGIEYHIEVQPEATDTNGEVPDESRGPSALGCLWAMQNAEASMF